MLPDAIFSVVDKRTRVVAVSHVEFWNGFRVDIEAIGAECRRRGIVFAVDVMQSVGALRVDAPDPLAAWQGHLQTLRAERDALNDRRLTALRYTGVGTDLTVALPSAHVWCTACLETKSGVPFVANLPTEEVFTAPDRESATGAVRVARPVSYGGAVIDGIELEFARGRVVRAVAHTGGELLQRLLATDDGAACLGEVALVPQVPLHGRTTRHFFHPLLDENAASHLALGQAYGFTSRDPHSLSLNQSLIHVDLPLAATVDRVGAEPT